MKNKEKTKEQLIREIKLLQKQKEGFERKRYKYKKVEHNLRERIKELNCLYGFSKLVESHGHSLEKIFQSMVNLIPPAWQYPEITCVRLTFEDNRYETENFTVSNWKQVADIKVDGGKAGMLEVYYSEEKPNIDEGPFLREERSLIDVIAERSGKIVERIRAEEALRKRTYDLDERVKELNCLYGLSILGSTFGISLEEIFQKTVYLIPPAWQYPEITCARIVFEDNEFTTGDFKATKWTQSAEIKIHGKGVGTIEVGYLRKKAESNEGPFLKEERALIETMAGQLGVISEQKKDEEALKNSELSLMEQKKALENKNIALRELLVQIEIEKKKIEDDVTANIDVLVLPLLEKVKLEDVNSKNLDLLQDTLKEITASFGNKISQKRIKLTPREIEICNMIKNGLTSKEISTLLNISMQTIEWHRKYIRRKTELTNKDVNLMSYLMKL